MRISISPAAPLVYATVDSVPVLSLGGPAASGPTQFSGIRGIHVSPAGTIWVADFASAEVRLFDASGAHLASLGGRGEGPGEFQYPRPLGAISGDTVLVTDDAAGRITVYDREGGHVRDELVSAESAAPNLRAVLSNGDLVGQIPLVVQVGSVEAGATLGDSARFVRWNRETDARAPLGTAPAPIWLWDGRSQVPLPFTVSPGVATDGSLVYLTSGPAFRIRAFDASGLIESFGVARAPQPADEASRADYRRYLDALYEGPTLQAHLDAMRHPDVPTELPAYSGLVVSADGDVWARRYTPDLLAAASFDVFGADRVYLGEVVFPPRFSLRAVRGDEATGIWLDELNVQYVRTYRLVWRAAR